VRIKFFSLKNMLESILKSFKNIYKCLYYFICLMSKFYQVFFILLQVLGSVYVKNKPQNFSSKATDTEFTLRFKKNFLGSKLFQVYLYFFYIVFTVYFFLYIYFFLHIIIMNCISLILYASTSNFLANPGF
jgi:hypothetical protein